MQRGQKPEDRDRKKQLRELKPDAKGAPPLPPQLLPPRQLPPQPPNPPQPETAETVTEEEDADAAEAQPPTHSHPPPPPPPHQAQPLPNRQTPPGKPPPGQPGPAEGAKPRDTLSSGFKRTMYEEAQATATRMKAGSRARTKK